jgi:hypothetical protein
MKLLVCCHQLILSPLCDTGSCSILDSMLACVLRTSVQSDLSVTLSLFGRVLRVSCLRTSTTSPKPEATQVCPSLVLFVRLCVCSSIQQLLSRRG